MVEFHDSPLTLRLRLAVVALLVVVPVGFLFGSLALAQQEPVSKPVLGFWVVILSSVAFMSSRLWSRYWRMVRRNDTLMVRIDNDGIFNARTTPPLIPWNNLVAAYRDALPRSGEAVKIEFILPGSVSDPQMAVIGHSLSAHGWCRPGCQARTWRGCSMPSIFIGRRRDCRHSNEGRNLAQ